jgi:iron complex outermembrane receptor protein
MKFTIILLAITICQVKASIFAQKISLSVKNASLTEVISKIRKQTKIDILYNSNSIASVKPITLEVKNEELKTVLDRCLQDQPLTYQFIKNTVLITEKLVMQQVLVSQSVSTAVSGKVTSDKGEPLSGVTVKVKNAPTSVATNNNGEYKIIVPNGGILIFSFIGYEVMEITVNKREIINVTLQVQNTGLNEVVVVGYGTSKKSDLTGSVGSVKAKDFNKGITVAPEQLIQGKVAGLQIGSNNGAPASETTVRIRGANSLRAGDQPLFVVDGVPLDGRNTQPSVGAPTLGSTPGSNPLSFLNSNDIESIDVLKDASATAIYGSRGANGVIIITTKKGKIGAPEIQLIGSAGIGNLLRSNKEMNTRQFQQALTDRNLTQFDGKSSTDAIKAITRTAVSQNFNLAIGSGTEKGNYRISLGYTDQQGIIRKSDFKKYVANIAGGYNFLRNDRVRIDFNVIAAKTRNIGVPIGNNSNLYGSLIGNALEWNPTVPLRYPDGTFVQQNYTNGTISIPGVGTNPLALIDYFNDKSDVSNILANISPSIKIIDGLVYKFTVGLNHVSGNRTTDISGKLFLNGITDLGFANVGNNQLSTTTITNTLNYTKDFSSRISFNALLGYEFIDFKNSNYNVSGTGFTSFDVLGSSILQNPTTGNISASSYVDPTNQLQSYFSRVNFIFDQKYLLTATMRADGSTKFGANNKYGYFPSVAAAWVISKEGFLPEAINNLKLRLGYGRTGNQQFPAGSAQDRYSFGKQSISQVNYGNANLKWETTNSHNAGFDFGLFNNRITGTVEYFNKQTKDLLFLLTLVQPGPAVNYYSNLPAVLTNKGAEAALNFVAVEKENFSWNIGVNATFQKNLFSNYSGPVILTGNINGSGLASGIPSQQIANNQPLFVYNMVRYLGLDANGTALYSADKQYVGDPNPKTLLGASTSVNYGKFSFDMSWNGAFGQKIYNNTRMINLAPSGLAIGRNTTSAIGLSNEALTNANVVSTRFLENGNYIRLNNATLSYNIGNIGEFKKASVFFTGQNLLLITNYSGFDPEVSTDKSVNGVPSFGIDYGAYPSARSFLIGFNISF